MYYRKKGLISSKKTNFPVAKLAINVAQWLVALELFYLIKKEISIWIAYQEWLMVSEKQLYLILFKK